MALAQLFRGSFSNNEVQSMERFNSCWIVCWMFMVQITIHSDLLLVSGLHQLCRSLDWICGQEFLGKFTLNLVSMISFLYVTDLPSLILSCPIMFHYSSLILLAILPKLCYHNFSLPTSLFILLVYRKEKLIRFLPTSLSTWHLIEPMKTSIHSSRASWSKSWHTCMTSPFSLHWWGFDFKWPK